MEIEHNALRFETFVITVPEGCPQPDIFRKVIKDILAEWFEQPELAAQCRDAWQAVRTIPEPFASNREAAYYYRRAMLELNPQAKAWDDFTESAIAVFQDYDEQGDDQQQPIPGWTPCSADIEIAG